MQLIYEDKKYNEFKTKNWKKMHNICKKAIPRNKYNEKLLLLDFNSKYISKRNKKKKKKNSFKSKLNVINLIQLEDKPGIYHIYKRYGYMPKTFKRKLKRKVLKEKKSVNITLYLLQIKY